MPGGVRVDKGGLVHAHNAVFCCWETGDLLLCNKDSGQKFPLMKGELKEEQRFLDGSG